MSPLNLLALVAALVFAFSVSACSGTSTRQSPAEQALVTPEEIARVSADSPSGVVLRLWKTVQVGDVPSAVGFYDPMVRRKLGFDNVVGALAQQRSSVALLRPHIVSITQTPLGLELIVKVTSRESGVGIMSFLLRHGSQGWRVIYDTLLGDALPTFVQSHVQEQIAPGSSVPSAIAQRASHQVSAAYQALFANALQPPPKPPSRKPGR